MKNNDHQHIQEARAHKMHRSMPTDILVIPQIAARNAEKRAAQPRRKRRVNYTKKIMNDGFIFTV